MPPRVRVIAEEALDARVERQALHGSPQTVRYTTFRCSDHSSTGSCKPCAQSGQRREQQSSSCRRRRLPSTRHDPHWMNGRMECNHLVAFFASKPL
jgi:hypothetical protein